MTPIQFDALARLAGLDDASRSREAARLVLCEGLTQAEAARQIGITRVVSGRAVKRCQEALELARVAVDQPVATTSKP